MFISRDIACDDRDCRNVVSTNVITRHGAELLRDHCDSLAHIERPTLASSLGFPPRDRRFIGNSVTGTDTGGRKGRIIDPRRTRDADRATSSSLFRTSLFYPRMRTTYSPAGRCLRRRVKCAPHGTADICSPLLFMRFSQKLFFANDVFRGCRNEMSSIKRKTRKE
jgi:hypothetical protein